MNLKASLRILLCMLFVAATLLNAQNLSAANPNFAVTTFLSPKEAAALFDLYFSQEAVFGKQNNLKSARETYWTPTAADVAQAQRNLADFTRAGVDTVDPKWSQFEYRPHDIVLTTDFRQYAGITRGDKKFVLINGITAPDTIQFVPALGAYNTDGSWREQASLRSDGGSSFRAVYDLTTHRIDYLAFNRFVNRETFHAAG